MRWAWRGMGPVLLGMAAWGVSLGCEPAALPPPKTSPATQTEAEPPGGLGTLSPADLKLLFPELPRPFAALGSAAVPIAAEEGAVAVSNDGELLWGDGPRCPSPRRRVPWRCPTTASSCGAMGRGGWSS